MDINVAKINYPTLFQEVELPHIKYSLKYTIIYRPWEDCRISVLTNMENSLVGCTNDFGEGKHEVSEQLHGSEVDPKTCDSKRQVGTKDILDTPRYLGRCNDILALSRHSVFEKCC